MRVFDSKALKDEGENTSGEGGGEKSENVNFRLLQKTILFQIHEKRLRDAECLGEWVNKTVPTSSPINKETPLPKFNKKTK